MDSVYQHTCPSLELRERLVQFPQRSSLLHNFSKHEDKRTRTTDMKLTDSVRPDVTFTNSPDEFLLEFPGQGQLESPRSQTGDERWGWTQTCQTRHGYVSVCMLLCSTLKESRDQTQRSSSTSSFFHWAGFMVCTVCRT